MADVPGAFNKVQATLDSARTPEQLYVAKRFADLHVRLLKGQHRRDVETVYWELYKWKALKLHQGDV